MITKKITDFFNESPNIRLSFRSLFISMLTMEIINSSTTIIDSLVVSGYLGDIAIASIGLTYAIMTFQKLLAGLIAGGTQIACSIEIGYANTKKANQIFSTSIMVSLIISACLMLLGSVFANDLAGILGANRNPELIIPTAQYIRGILLGMPFSILTSLMIPVLQMDGAGKLVRISTFVTIATDVLFDFLAVYFAENKIFAVGLATSLSYVGAFMVMLIHFFSKKAQLKFLLRDIRFSLFSQTLGHGFFTAFYRSMSIIRSIIMNYIILSFVSTYAMSAFSLFSNLKSFLTAIPAAIGSSAILFASNLMVKRDLKGLRQVFKSSFFYGVIVMILLGVIVFITAGPIFSLFSLHEETLASLVFIFKLFAFVLPLWGIKFFYISYFQGVELKKISMIFSLMGELVLVVIPCFLLSHLYAIRGIWIGLAVAELLSIILLLVFVIIHNKHFPASINDLMLLPKGFLDEEVAVLDPSARDAKDMEDIHRLLKQFCTENNIDDKREMAIRLSVEELSEYLFKNYQKRKGHLIDIQIRYLKHEDTVILNFRYNDPSFNPMTIYGNVDRDRDEAMKNLGIRLVCQMNKDISYVHFVSYGELLAEL